MQDREQEQPSQITDGVDTPTGQIWPEEITGTPIPDLGWTQHYDVVKELADCYAGVGDFQSALHYYDKAANLGPDEPGPYVGMGVIALQQNRPDDAETAFRVACRLDPKCSKGYCGRAMVAEQKNDWPQAFEWYLKSLELNGDDLTALLGLFQMSCRIGSFEKVIYYLQMYLNMHPGDTSVMFCLATLLLREGQPGSARQLLRDLLVLQPDHLDAVHLLEEVENKLTQPVCQES
ncbi:MAG: tetratricopeptide repeat protein [Sedimentisphaerales bacterium]|nr:tetratricopeptide repeat protein [Sedimentisphaerales bacterium]